jgi:thioredoxin-related protein
MNIFNKSIIVIFTVTICFCLFNTPVFSEEQAVGIYSSHKNPVEEIKSAVSDAGNDCRRILLVFGADWCPWCNRLSHFFDENVNVAASLKSGFIVVKVDLGRWDKNLDLVNKFKVNRKAGIPSFVVLDSKGEWIKFQETGVLEEGKGYSESKILQFLKDNKTPKDEDCKK